MKFFVNEEMPVQYFAANFTVLIGLMILVWLSIIVRTYVCESRLLSREI